MPVFHIEANDAPLGCYTADTKEAALDLAAQDAGYASVADMDVRTEQPSELIATEIDTDALIAAVSIATGHAVFDDAYGDGVALVDNASIDTWEDLAELADVNVWDFPA